MHIPGKDEDRNRGSVDDTRKNVLRRARIAHRQTHHGQRGHHQEADAAAEIAAVNGDKKLRQARGARRQMRFPTRRGFTKKLPQANSAVANSTSHGTRWAKIDGGVARRMSAPRAPPMRLMTNNPCIVSPVGL